MGFSSIEANGIVDNCVEKGLLGKEQVMQVLKFAKEKDMDYLAAGKLLAEGKVGMRSRLCFKGWRKMKLDKDKKIDIKEILKDFRKLSKEERMALREGV